MELRDEIVESQKVRSDLFKWKILLVATLGAIALGFSSEPANAASVPSFDHLYLLCLIPLVGLYVDILCSHLNLRILVIGRYFQYVAAARGVDAEPRQAEYEQFVEQARNLTSDLVDLGKRQQSEERNNRPVRTFSAFSYEDLAQHLSSFILSACVLLWGVLPLPGCVLGVPIPDSLQAWPPPHGGDRKIFISAGMSGMALSALAYCRYRSRLHALRGLVASRISEVPAAEIPMI